jgi:hypothetical protein
VIQNISTKKSQGTDVFIGELYQTFKELTLILLKLFPNIEEIKILSNLFSEANITLTPKPKKDY